MELFLFAFFFFSFLQKQRAVRTMRSTIPRVNDLEEYLTSSGFAKKDVKSCALFLQMIEEHELRRSASTFKAGEIVLEHTNEKLRKRSFLTKILFGSSSSMVNKHLSLLEQTFIASLDTSSTNLKRSLELFNELKVIVEDTLGQKNSQRLKRLEGMLFEASGEFDKAMEHYDAILEDQPTEQRVMRRRIAVLESRNETKKCLEALNKYLDVFMDDVEAWEHAGKIYAKLFMHEQAIFCFEECICSAPSNYHHHRRVAEQLYALGGFDNLRRASTYYAAAIDMSTGADVRALYGCILTRNQLVKSHAGSTNTNNSSSSNDKNSLEAVENLAAAAAERLEQMYAIKQEELLGIVRQTVKEAKK